MTSSNAPSRCKNCNTELRGPFCHQCGQEDRDFDIPFRNLAQTAIDDVIGLDTRFWRTLRPLLTRPGFLTREYFAGRLEPYVPPFKLYIFVTMLFFVVLTLTKSTVVNQVIVEEDGASSRSGAHFTWQIGDKSKASADSEATLSGEESDGESDSATSVRETGAATWLERQARKAAELMKNNPEGLNRSLRDRLSQVLLVLVPVFALFLRFLYRRQLRHYQHHLVFSLHVHSAIFLALTIVLPFDRLLGFAQDGPLGSAVELGGIVYLFLALRQVYGESRRRTVIKLLVLLIVHTMVGMITLSVTLLWVLLGS